MQPKTREWLAYTVATGAVVACVFGLLSLRMPTPERLARYTSTAYGFSAAYPAGFVIHEEYAYEGAGPIRGVSFSVPRQYVRGTNLLPDSRVSVEVYSKPVERCSVGLFLKAAVSDPNATSAQVKGDTASGQYEERISVIEGSSPCTAIRYVIHSGEAGTYARGEVRSFNQEEVLRLFDTVRTSIRLER